MKRQILKSFLTLVLAMLAMGSYAQDTKEYVDLGLPSGTLWATCNVGASAPEQTGNYYAWGETTTKGTYVQTNYAFGDEGSYTKYCTLEANGTVDGKTTLDAADDAATANWGSEWCMPTTAQLEELWSTCTKASVTQNGVACYKLTGTNGNFILMPKAGAMGVNGLQNEGMLICNSREMETGVEGRTDLYVYTLMPSHLEDMSSIRRFIGVPVRAVLATKIDYSLSNGGTTITITPGANLTEVKTALGDAVSDITELYITGSYSTTASINALKTVYFPNIDRVHLSLAKSAADIDFSAYSDCPLLSEILVSGNKVSIGGVDFSNWEVTTSALATLSGIHLLIEECNFSKVVSLKIKGTINSYDIMVMRNKFTSLRHLDLEDARIVANDYQYYTGFCSKNDEIERYAIRTDMESLKLPKTLKIIGDHAFFGCNKLTEVKIFDSVISIGNQAFYECDLVTDIVLPNSLTNIGNRAFYGCRTFTDIEIPNSVTTLGECVFAGCSNLSSVTIGNSVINIPNEAFSGCSSLARINIPSSVISIGDRAFSGCSNLVDIVIPNSVKSIGKSTFQRCSKLKSIEIPNSVNCSIGTYAFSGCIGLKDITIGNSITGIDEYAFENCTALTSIIIPNSVEGGIDRYAFSGCSTLADVTIGNSVTFIGSYAFVGCSKLTNVTIGKSLKTIGQYAFRDCTNLTNIEIPNSVTKIDYFAFWGCYSLERITLPFTGCDGTIATGRGGTVDTSFGRIFGGDVNQNYLYTATDQPTNDMRTFTYRIPRSLKEVKITNKIYKYAFYGCADITRIEVDANVEIAPYAFHKCNFTTFVIPTNSNLKTIPDHAFADCTNLKNIQLPISIRSIASSAFQNCTGLTSIKIPSGITDIGNNAFKGCTNLNDVYTYTVEPQKIDQNTFDVYNTATLHVPAVSRLNYFYDTQWSQFLKTENFDEPYDYALIQNDYEMMVDNVGVLRGNPLFDVLAGGAFILKGDNAQQTSRELHLKCSAPGNKWAALIPQSGTFATTKLYIDIEVNKDFWYAFTFPFDVNLDEVQKEGDWVFRRYDGSMRAADGSGGWCSVEGNTLTANKGYIFRSNVAGTLSIPVSAPTFATENKDIALSQYASSLGAQHANWNFIGNPYTGFYEVSEEDYNAPIVIFNGTGYEAYRPGDDHVALHPFQALFTQASLSRMGFNKTRRMSQTESEASAAKANARIASEARMRKAKGFGVNDRLLINLVLSDGENSDKTRIVYNEKQQMGYEAECDAAKFLSTEAVPQLYSLDDSGVKYAINERPQHDGYVQLGYVAPAAGTFTLSASRMDVDVLIHDNVENVTFNLAEGDYTFESEAGTFTERFAMALAEPTAVQSIAAGAKAEGSKAYDLNGRVAAKDARGVVVKNGKKQVVK